MHRPRFVENLLSEIDTALRTLMPPKHRISSRLTPAKTLSEPELNPEEKRHVAGLMRVNHAGEVCAQALYRGQAITARDSNVKKQLADAAAEEIDHLAWCEERLQELASQPSLLNPVWYIGSLTLGMVAGAIGDRFSLGFLAETEFQVSRHLQNHLQKLPKHDHKTKTILEQMHEDESHHAYIALHAGAMDLPFFIKQLMQGASKIMTRSSYYL
jgi:ubiquinone biosynthesis monooxygenase Coq7